MTKRRIGNCCVLSTPSLRHCQKLIASNNITSKLYCFVLKIMETLPTMQSAKNFSCSICGKSLSSQKYLNMHFKEHTKEKLYKCGKCDKLFDELSELKDHLKSYQTKRSFVAEQTKTADSLVMHTKTFRFDPAKHEAKRTFWKPYVCEVCGKGFTKLDSVKTHAMIHNVEPKISCEICNKMYFPTELRTHLQVHNGEKPFVCDKCGKGFMWKCLLDQHSKSHSDVHLYKCGTCNKGFKSGSSLKKHVLIHLEMKEPKPYKCNQCLYTCRSGSKLSQHTKKHMVDELQTNGQIVCLLCNDTFATEDILKIHINTHSVSFLDM